MFFLYLLTKEDLKNEQNIDADDIIGIFPSFDKAKEAAVKSYRRVYDLVQNKAIIEKSSNRTLPFGDGKEILSNISKRHWNSDFRGARS